MTKQYKRKINYNSYKSNNLLEAKKKMQMRFARNKISINLSKGSKILVLGSLDYILGIEQLGKNEIYTCDVVNKPNFIKKKIKHSITNLKKLKFNDSFFDFVFCNGILSHTKNHLNLLKEMYRVLKKDGKLWLNVYGDSKLSKFENSINKKLDYNDKIKAKKILQFYKWDPSKINFILELFFFDAKYVFEKKILEKRLQNLNFKVIKFCKRGIDSDFSELVYKNPKLKKFLGNGDLRFLLKKV
jgi:ubiquinone/menaquinone biosynthesis C-methylase UbiE